MAQNQKEAIVKSAVDEPGITKWEVAPLHELLETKIQHEATMQHLEKMLGVVLPKMQEAIVCEFGPVLTCLQIRCSADSKEFRVAVCVMSDDGEVQPRIEATDENAIALIKAYLSDHPRAVLLNNKNQPCSFLGGDPPRILGPATFETFCNIAVQAATNRMNIVIAVP